MGNVHRLRTNAYRQGQKKRKKSGSQGPSHALRGLEQTFVFSFKRTDATLLIPQGIGFPPLDISAQVILNDLQPTEATVFSNMKLAEGQEVELTFECPRSFSVSGTVVYCNRVQLESRVISLKPHPFRIKLELSFLNDGDRLDVKNFCEELSETILKRAA
jgi:hypothetical protein